MKALQHSLQRSLQRFLIVLSLAAAAAVAAPPGPPPGAPLDIDKLAILLDLDEYQKNEVEGILLAQRATMEAEREQHFASGERPTREEMEAMRAAHTENLVTELSAVLTATQLEKFRVLMEMMRPAFRPRSAMD